MFTLKEIHDSIRNIAKSILFYEIGEDNDFLELYYHFRSASLQGTLESLMQRILLIRDNSSYEIKTQFFLSIVETRYFNPRRFHSETDDIFMEELNQMYLMNTYLLHADDFDKFYSDIK